MIYNKALIGLDYEKDLGVRVSSDFSQRKQCIEARNKANRVLGYIFRKSVEVILELY